MVGEGFSIVKLLQMATEVKPLCIVVGTHHFVQMSELDFQSEGINKKDIASVLWITPVGATVPPITSINLRKKFPNMAVSLLSNNKTDIDMSYFDAISNVDCISFRLSSTFMALPKWVLFRSEPVMSISEQIIHEFKLR